MHKKLYISGSDLDRQDRLGACTCNYRFIDNVSDVWDTRDFRNSNVNQSLQQSFLLLFNGLLRVREASILQFAGTSQ